MKATNNKVLIYLWTRDAQLPIDQETEDYVVNHLEALHSQHIGFSDTKRENMVERILKRIS